MLPTLLLSALALPAVALASPSPTDPPVAPAEEGSGGETTSPAPEPPPVDTASAEPPPATKTGWGWAGLPTPNYTSTNGVGYGLYLAVYNYGEDGSGDEPYKAKIAGQFYQTTKWYMDHFLNVDVTDIKGTGVRWDMKAGWEAWKQAHYYGQGNHLPRLRPEDMPNDDYYIFALNSARVFTNVRIPVSGRFETLVNYYGRYAMPLHDVYPENLLSVEKPAGYDGGYFSQLSAGVLYDSRDQEPSPTRGMFSEVSVRGASWLLGSTWNFVGFNLTDRRWYNLAGDGKLVFANRFIADWRIGEDPYFDDFVLGGSQFVQIGGSLSMRGLDDGRYRGNVILLLDPELRWTVVSPHIKKSVLDIMLVPFGDITRVWYTEKDEPDAPLHLHYSAGVGTRFAWNKNFLVRLDVAWGFEEYAPLGTTVETLASVTPDQVEREPQFGLYLVFDHPF